MKFGHIAKIVGKALDGQLLIKEEIGVLFSVPIKTEESGYIQWASREISEQVSQGTAEIHAQVGINIAACPNNCLFCSFAVENKVFDWQTEVPVEDVIEKCIAFENDGANAIYLMCTADFSFDKYIEIASAVRNRLKKETVMIANVGDFNAAQAKCLKDSGFSGIYHAVRMGEGVSTRIDPQMRINTFQVARDAELLLGTCVEPIGPEHTIDELVEKTLIARDAHPVYSGAARRIPIPGTKLASLGIVSEAKMAHILAVVRLATGFSVSGNCTHEPNSIGAMAGANLFWAESGSNPRDEREKTEHNRGFSVKKCKEFFNETEWAVVDGPSRFFRQSDETMIKF